jgi:glycerophosphoryl diester phosphodiesterase
MPRLRFSVLALVALLGARCAGDSAGLPEDASSPAAVADSAAQVDLGQPDLGAAEDAATEPGEDEGPGDVAADPGKLPPPRLPPFVPGPPAELYDCTATNKPPGRLSTIPLGCVLDPECTERMVVAHRGAGGQAGVIAPENSLSAIRAALHMGVDGVELDVRHTKDEVLVLMHDSSLERTTGNTAKVGEMSAAEVTAIPLLPPPNEDAPGDFSCERVPTLADAFELTRDRLFIDLDTKTSRIDLVVAAIAGADLYDQVFISVSDVARAVEAREIDPKIRVQIRPDTILEYEQARALFGRMPEIIEVPSALVADIAARVRQEGGMPFADVFVEDAAAYLKRSGDLYLDLYEEGAGVLQTELPPQVLKALGRWNF